MAFVIAGGCCNDASCVDVCPVDCIRPRPEDPEFMSADQLYIDPDTCIDCAACMYACPVDAIHDGWELDDHVDIFASLNRDYFRHHPLRARFRDAAASTAPETRRARVAIVGTGPAGCYTAAELSEIPGVEVTVLDQAPTPFGLVRHGVAPDHPDTKLVSRYFETVLTRRNVSCYLNTKVGVDVSMEELQASHHAVIYAGGASADRRLDIPGEGLPGSHSAREFISWFSGDPGHSQQQFDLRGPTAVIVGNGNVALDVARLLMSPPDALSATDIADHALDELRGGSIRHVVIAARRGPEEAACTYSELLALTRLPGVDVRADPDEVARGHDRVVAPDARRKAALFRELSVGNERPTGRRQITFRFGIEPHRIVGDRRVDAVEFRSRSRPDAQPEEIQAGLLLRAIGYRVAPVAGLPYDHQNGTLAHTNGRLQGAAGLYCVGWAKRGPSGFIGTNKSDARETVATLLEDLDAGALHEPNVSRSELDTILRSRRPDLVDWSGWRAIDEHERRAGQSSTPARPRRKLVTLDSLLAVAAGPGATESPTGQALVESEGPP